MPDHVLGIDLGTTFSVVAVLDRDGKPKTIANEEGDLLTPSVVFFDRVGTVVGREAVRACEVDPQRGASFAKRDMGEDRFQKKILGHSFPPEVIQALVLQKLKRDVELKLGPVQQAVITVPAYFNEPRRKATQDAGRLAGLEVIDILNEPTAAALAYGIEQGILSVDGELRKPERVLVYDLGGGTFDATLVEIEPGRFNAIATAGDVRLGGIDWDERLMNFLAQQFQRQHRIDLTLDESSKERLLNMTAEMKRALTARHETVAMLKHGGKVLQLTVTRKQFEEVTADLLDRTRLTVRKLLNDAALSWESISRVLLVGGSTRMPMVQKMLEEESGKQVDRSLSPDEAVAHGAAIYAGMLSRAKGAKNRSTSATGANSVFSDFSVRNVNSHHLGVLGIDPVTQEPRRKIVIARNTPLPAANACRFQTSRENQRDVVVTVVEGGTETGDGATVIGKCVVQQLPPHLPKATPVNVKFRYRGDGRLEVYAELPTIARQAKMTIQRTASLSEDDIIDWTRRLNEGISLETASEESTDEEVAEEPVKAEESNLQEAEDTGEGDSPPPENEALHDFFKTLNTSRSKQ